MKPEQKAYKQPVAIEPITGEDYYLENGLVVMTAAYHRKRGYCCGSGCRHCPYLPKHQLGASALEEECAADFVLEP